MRQNTLAYFASYSLSLLGNGIASVLLPLLVLARTGDVLAAGVVASVTAGISALIGPFAGVLIDRVNRRTISIASDILSAGAVMALPIVDGLWGLTMHWFVILAILGAFGDAPGMTAREVLLPRLARENSSRPDVLDRLVGTREALSGALMLAAPGLGGLLIAIAGVGSTTLFITAGTSLAAAVLSFGIRHSAGEPEKNGEMQNVHGHPIRSVISDLLAALRFLLKNRLVLGATLLTALFVAASAALQTSLLPAYFTAQDLPGLTGLVLSCMSAGGLIGAGVYAVVAGKISRRTWFVVGMVGTTAGYFGLGVLAAPWLVVGSAFVIGLTGAPVSAAIGVATIEATPDNVRGRILSAQNAITMAAPAISAAPIAAIASGFGLSNAGITLAVIIAAACALSIAAPAFRNLNSISTAPSSGRGNERVT
ncbi:MFS transporter [Leucobacter insecticola]|uniref:MFS transporter n=1 Tax=Leucobacter insecticola TaxID=2714934 RepID=A0A6G8FLC2_9MICO|nr:MFS transporter [Leucobacter insecticola]QIM17151.1 MFS transporter [Leucobacter insecticola]